MAKAQSPPRLAAISFYYPPVNNPRAIQVARLLRNLQIPTVLICAEHDRQNDREDSSLIHHPGDTTPNIIRVPFAPSAFTLNATRFAGRVIPPFWESLPDATRGWKEPVINSFANHLATGDLTGTVLVTFGSPMNDHLIGLDLKRRFRLPWMAHFSDPWVDNPFNSYNTLTRQMNSRYERSVVESADRLLFTSVETVDLVMGKYDSSLRSKTRIVPHSYEPGAYPQEMNDQRSEIIVRFLGDMYGPRTPKPLFDALSLIVNADSHALENVSFEFIGSMCDLNLSSMGINDLPRGLVNLRETVSNTESLNLMSSADALMVIDAPAVKSVFLPSKLVDYIGARRPLLGITPPGTASNLIVELGGWTADPSRPDQVALVINEFVGFLRQRKVKRQEGWGDEAVRQRFLAENVASQFEKAVLELLATGN